MRHAFAAGNSERYELRGLCQRTLQLERWYRAMCRLCAAPRGESLEGLLLWLRGAVRASLPHDSQLIVERIEQALTHAQMHMPAGSS
jgi:hypothetical protein